MVDDEFPSELGSLIPLRIGAVECQVPEGTPLLRCFQYLRPYAIAMGGFCWNADCHTCEVRVRTGALPAEQVLACQTTVAREMEVVDMTEKLKWCLRDLVKGS